MVWGTNLVFPAGRFLFWVGDDPGSGRVNEENEMRTWVLSRKVRKWVKKKVRKMLKWHENRVRAVWRDFEVLVAKQPTGGVTRVGVEELGATSRHLALHWSQCRWFVVKKWCVGIIYVTNDDLACGWISTRRPCDPSTTPQ
jgi:hypothetical protein